MKRKLCALTFDDGPDNNQTALVLEKLQKYKVNATFFMIGNKVDELTRTIIEKLVSLGNEIGNHSWDHSEMKDMNIDEITKSVLSTQNVIKKFSGSFPKFFRPPYLSTSKLMFKQIQFPFVGGISGFDWSDQGTSAQDRADKIFEKIEDGSIILLHDVQPPPHPTPEALDIIIPELKEKGYEFVTLSELFKRKNINLELPNNKIWVTVK